MTLETETTNSPTPPIETPPDSSLIGNPPAGEKTPEEIAAEAAAAETPEAKAEREAGEAAETARLAPLTVETLTLPEGMTTTDELRAEFVETVNKLSELGPTAAAEALLNLQAKALTAASEASSAAWSSMQDQWRNEVKADLGDKLQPTLDSINRLTTEFGSPQLLEALALTGAGNNLQVIKFLGKIADKMTEGGYSAGAPSGAETTAAQRLYPSMKG